MKFQTLLITAAALAAAVTCHAAGPSSEVYSLSENETADRGFRLVDGDVYSLDGELLIDLTDGITPEGRTLDPEFRVVYPTYKGVEFDPDSAVRSGGVHHDRGENPDGYYQTSSRTPILYVNCEKTEAPTGVMVINEGKKTAVSVCDSLTDGQWAYMPVYPSGDLRLIYLSDIYTRDKVYFKSSLNENPYGYSRWNWDKGCWELTDLGREIWEEAIEVRNENPSAYKFTPAAVPDVCEERMNFTINVKNKDLAPFMEDIAGHGNEIEATIYRSRNFGLDVSRTWDLALQGEGGRALLRCVVMNTFGEYDHNNVGSILCFPLESLMDDSGKNLGFKPDDGYKYLYVKANPKGGDIFNLQVWMPDRGVSHEIDGGLLNGEFITDTDRGQSQTDILKCKDVDYEYCGDPEKFENGKNLYTLFSVSHDVDEYIAEMKRKEEFAKKYDYDEGPDNNHKKPMRYDSWNGKDDGGSVHHDFNIVFEIKAKLPFLNTSAFQYLKGIGDSPEITIFGIQNTTNGEVDDFDFPYPLMRVKGSKGEVWFDISMSAGDSDDGGSAVPGASYVRLYKLKDFKNWVKYEDLTKPDEEISFVAYFDPETKTKLEKIVFDFGPLTDSGEKEAWTVYADRLSFTGDLTALREIWYDKNDGKEDFFGMVLKALENQGEY